MNTRPSLTNDERRRIEDECELLSRWFPQRFPSALMQAIEQGKIHGGLFLDPKNDGCGDLYSQLIKAEVWQQVADLVRGVIAALQLDGEEMTPLQSWTDSVRPGQTQHSSPHLRILYDDILPKYQSVQTVEESPNAIKPITLLRDGDVVILCEKGHLKMSLFQRTTPNGKKLSKPRLYPFGNWKILEEAARTWLQQQGITLQEGECVICPPTLTLEDMMGPCSPSPYDT